ncbi:MAG: PEP-CTERM sorting domain-containing protein [Pseudomonadota bacterium]
MSLGKSLAKLGVVGILLAPTPSWAITIWQNPAAGDWFDPANWNNGVPTAIEDAFVNNGGTAIGSAGGPALTNTLGIGIRTEGLFPPPGSTGTVQMNDVDLQVDLNLVIGRVDMPLVGALASAEGNLSTTGSANANGDVSVGGDGSIGHFVMGFSNGTATGIASIAGNLTGGGTLEVGSTEGTGTGDGTAGIGGTLSDFNNVRVGRSSSSATGDAFGDLTVDGALMGTALGNFVVATTGSSGSATATAEIGTGVSDFSLVGVGISGSVSTADSLSDGSLTVRSGGVSNGAGGFSFEAGTTNGDGSVRGVVDITGDVGSFSFFQAGVTRQTGSLGNSTGDIMVTGDVTGRAMGDVEIGSTEGAGTADGTVEIGGSLSGFNNVRAGRSSISTTGDAFGDLKVDGALMGTALGNFVVATTGSSGSATATAEIGTGVSDFSLVGIGISGSVSTADSLSDGSLTVLSGGVSNSAGGFSFEAGTTNGDGSVRGVVDITGDVGSFSFFQVGVTRQTGSLGNSTGDVMVTGDVVGRALGNASIGRNEGAGTADGTVEIGGSLSGFNNVRVAPSSSGATGDAFGDLTVDGALMGTALGNLIVASTGSSGSATATAEIGSGISDFSLVGVGISGTVSTVGSLADGSLTVLSGGVSNAAGGFSFEVGTTNGDGSVRGVANITGDMGSFTFYEIGIVRNAGSQGNATGELNVNNGRVVGGGMKIGVSEGIGSASGTAAFDNVLVSLSDTLTLGDGSTLKLTMNGMDRGLGYAAIDANAALLDGALEVLFTFQPLAFSFDLIISGSSNGILGDFTSVSIMGLANGTVVTSGIVLDDFGNGLVEVYRLTVGGMMAAPEPGTLWLFAVALLGLVLVIRPGPVKLES